MSMLRLISFERRDDIVGNKNVRPDFFPIRVTKKDI